MTPSPPPTHPAGATSLATEARALTLKLLEQAARATSTAMHAPEIRFDLRGQSAGQFRVDRAGHCLIRYNGALLTRHGADFLRRTVPHETAHYVAYRLYGRTIRPHGPEWQDIMRQFGARPDRCHGYDVSGLEARQVRLFPYHCGCSSHRLTSIRHNRVSRGQRYLCRRCGEPLMPGHKQEQ